MDRFLRLSRAEGFFQQRDLAGVVKRVLYDAVEKDVIRMVAPGDDFTEPCIAEFLNRLRKILSGLESASFRRRPFLRSRCADRRPIKFNRHNAQIAHRYAERNGCKRLRYPGFNV